MVQSFPKIKDNKSGVQEGLKLRYIFTFGRVIKNLPPNVREVSNAGVIPGSGRSPWRRAWQPAPVFLPGESQDSWTEEPGGLQSTGSQSWT